MNRFHPLPESREAADELDPEFDDLVGLGDGDWLDALVRLAEQASELVPALVGVSVARMDEGLTFTVVASDEDVAALDAIQYVDSGPCVEGARSIEQREYHQDDVLDERRWALFARATAAHGIRSTLTLPVLGGGRAAVVGSVNLYAGSGDAFAGRAEALAEIFGAYAAGAVSDADLPFATREDARRAPTVLRDALVVETAVVLLAAELGLEPDEALSRLEAAAHQAGVTTLRVAHEVVRAHRGGPDAS